MTSGVRLSKRFEYMLVILVTGVIALVAIDRYQALGRETQRLGFELLSHRFAEAAAHMNVHWLLQQGRGGNPGYLDLEGKRIYVNAQGWPRGARPVSQPLRNEDCAYLWDELLQNPPPASLQGAVGAAYVRGEQRYHIGLRLGEVCRYELLLRERTVYAFEYDTRTGQVRLVLPPVKN